MAKEKYIAINENVDGYSFANLGLFTGFASGVYNAVYSLVILGIFTGILGNENLASSVVGVYVALYSIFCMILGVFSKELLRWFSKARLLYTAFLLVVVCYAMMSFSVKPVTFITLDYVSGIGSTIVGILIPLFMADFSKNIGMAKLNARYYFWVNIGALPLGIPCVKSSNSGPVVISAVVLTISTVPGPLNANGLTELSPASISSAVGL